MEKEKVQEIRMEMEKRYLKNDAENSKSLSMFHIVNSDGENYSRYQGWHKRDGEIYGHLFDSQQLKVALEVLKENGYEELSVEKDKTGTLFMLAANSPFSSPANSLKTLLFTLFIMVLLVIAIKISETDTLLKIVEGIKQNLINSM